MKVCILSFEESLGTKTLRGVFTTTKYLQDGLRSVGVDADLVVYGRNKLNYPDSFDIVKHCRTLEDLSELKQIYDFVIYFTPGRSWEKFDSSDPEKYSLVLEAVGLPFTTIYHSEEYKTHQPYRMNFIQDRNCKFLIFISDGFKDIYADDLMSCGGNCVTVSMLPQLKPIEDILNKDKKKSIILTSAWTNFKRNREYFELVSQFKSLGLEPYSAGAPASIYYLNEISDDIIKSIELDIDESTKGDELSRSRYFDYSIMMGRRSQGLPYDKKRDTIPHIKGATIKTQDGGYWYDYGAYYPDEIETILADKMYHWNMSGYKINKTYVPRLEIVTLEALNEGCLPIICKETTPDWIPEDSAIVFSKKDYKDRLGELNLSDEERSLRIKRFYDTVQENLYRGMYESLRDMIMEVV